jgi:hypothetical protein
MINVCGLSYPPRHQFPIFSSTICFWFFRSNYELFFGIPHTPSRGSLFHPVTSPASTVQRHESPGSAAGSVYSGPDLIIVMLHSLECLHPHWRLCSMCRMWLQAKLVPGLGSCCATDLIQAAFKSFCGVTEVWLSTSQISCCSTSFLSVWSSGIELFKLSYFGF